MLSDNECKRILEKNGNKYTFEEVGTIKQFLQELIGIHIEQILKKHDHDEEGSIDVESFKRRAG